MPLNHAYLIGVLGLGVIFSIFCIVRKDLRRAMIYSGIFYAVFMTFCFFWLKVLSHDTAKSVNPGYWSPPSLFNLNTRTGGEGIEDLLFMFFAPAIIAGIYELVFKTKVDRKINKRLKRGHAILIGFVTGSVAFAFTPLNAMYFLIFFQFVGAAVIIWQRRDLAKHSLLGGLLFLAMYSLLFQVFNLLYPSFVSSYDHLQHTTNTLIAGVPLEEYLYALSMGMMWAPLYEYEFRLKDSKRRSSRLRTGWPAVKAVRR